MFTKLINAEFLVYFMNWKYSKPSWQVLVPTIIVVSIISLLISINFLYKFIYNIIITGDIEMITSNYPAMILVIIITLIISYLIAICIQNIIHLKSVKLILGIAILVFALLLLHYTYAYPISTFAGAIYLCLFAISILLLGQAFRKNKK